jgi:hypothetical protein
MPPFHGSTHMTFVRIAIDGWLCVRCGEGRYRLGQCATCGLKVTRYVRLPRRLIKPALRGAA